MASNYLYFDNASTTKCSASAAATLANYTAEEFGNPSSAHSLGQRAARAIHDARVFFAGTFGVNPDQVIFTGSGTESDNLGVIGPYLGQARGLTDPAEIIISSVEHAAVRNAAFSLRDLGATVTTIPVGTDGSIEADRFGSALSDRTRVISIMKVNNVTGAILPVEELAARAKSVHPEIVFHTDAVQAFGKIDVPRAGSAVDLVSISAHKLHGPKGVGALIALNSALIAKKRLRPLVFGGNQEGGLRSGTPNPGLIAAFHVAAAEALRERSARAAHALALRARLRTMLIEKGLLSPDHAPARLTWNSPEEGAAHIVNLSAPGLPAGPLQKLLDDSGIAVSTGSACSSMSQDPDPALLAMGFSPQIASSALRVSFGPENTPDEVNHFVDVLDQSLNRMGRLLGLGGGAGGAQARRGRNR